MTNRILIVDDEPQVRRLLCARMTLDGHDVDEAANGREAIRKLDGGGYDLVISDILMPENDGLEVILHLRRAGVSLPLIAISAPGNDLFLDSARALGASRVFEKPFSMDELSGAVRELLTNSVTDS